MRDIIIFTDSKITKELCVDNLKSKINNMKDNGNDLFIDSKNRLYLIFSNERINKPISDSSNYFQEIIPIENAYLTFIETYRIIDAKRVVEVLLNDFPNMYIYIDDLDWNGEAKEFLDTELKF